MKYSLVFGLMVLMIVGTGCSKKHKVKAVRAAKASVETTVTTISSGTVYAEEQSILSFGSVGRVARVGVQEGDRVRKGQILASLENADLSIAAQTAQADLRRTQDLFKEGLVSQAALDEAKRATEMAQATLDRSIIKAPFDGLITDVNLRVGEVAQLASQADKPAIRIVDLKARLIKGEVDELDLGKVKQGLPARIKIPALGNRVLAARVTKTIPFVSSTREQDRTSQIELRLSENDSSIPVGASAEVEIVIENKPQALTLPARAVLGTSRQRYIYKIVENKLTRSNVQIGIGNYDRREVIEGVTEGDVVALPGENYEMKEGDEVEVEIQPWP